MNISVQSLRGAALLSRLQSRSATIGIAGLGYVGLPLAKTAAAAGYRVVGFDIDKAKVAKLARGQSYIDGVCDTDIKALVEGGRLCPTDDLRRFAECDVICICVPTPLTAHREPDLSYVVSTTAAIAKTLRRDQLIVLESTTFPGTTDDVMKPILEAQGLKSGRDFFLGYSPEREDPGNVGFDTASIPKVVAGDGSVAAQLCGEFYGAIVERVVPVSSIKVAEVVKLTENIFRAVNIALVNELKLIYGAMGIDIWEVIEAAKTKPFGFMPFYPGPGLGGHCIPIDPFYLTWKARQYEVSTKFIELAGEINVAMPQHVANTLASALDTKLGLAMSQATILIVGVAYKKNVADVRESPALKLIDLLEHRVADIAYHDPMISRIPKTRKHPMLAGKDCIQLSPDSIAAYDAAVIVTDHDDIDYGMLANHARLIVDTRNAMQSRGIICDRVVKA